MNGTGKADLIKAYAESFVASIKAATPEHSEPEPDYLSGRMLILEQKRAAL